MGIVDSAPLVLGPLIVGALPRYRACLDLRTLLRAILSNLWLPFTGGMRWAFRIADIGS